ncbi:MAG: trichohyalin-plectin-homology domain domain-containing protein, partial [archaeon]|nr:trichohyalin-plectin-homology domain domain-containing protein [archaeon]
MRKRIRSSNRYSALRDSAILSLGEYEHMKKSVQFTEEDFKRFKEKTLGQRSETDISHKKKIIDYDKTNKYLSLAEFDKDLSPSKIKQENIYMVYKDRQNDKMKEMTRLAMYAKIAQIRDKQLEERKYMENIFRKRDIALDKMMEMERLKELKFQMEKEEYANEQKRKGNRIVIEQIKESEHERLKTKDEMEKEKINIHRQIEKMLEEDKIMKERKIEEIKRKAREIEESNRKEQLNKEIKKIEEKEENLKILKFNLEKAKQEEELLRERKRIADEKEKETQRLREKQERTKDKQSELDALRAKRAFEESERKYRKQLEEEKKKKERMEKEVI